MTMKDKSNLIWIDLEMTGLDTQRDYIIEIASIVTDKNLNILAEGPYLVIHQPNEVMSNLDEWNTRQHGKSGLIERVLEVQLMRAKLKMKQLNFLNSLFINLSLHFVVIQFVKIEDFLHDACLGLKNFVIIEI